MRIWLLAIFAMIIGGCGTTGSFPVNRTTQIGAIEPLLESGVPVIPISGQPYEDTVGRPSFQQKLSALCQTTEMERSSKIAAGRAVRTDYLFAPEVALLPRSAYLQENVRTGYVLLEDVFEVVVFEGDLPSEDADYHGAEVVIGIPQGFVFDAQSIHPAIYFVPALGALLNPVRNEINSSLVHDWLYAVGEPGNDHMRKFADRAYKLLLRKYKVPENALGLASLAVERGGRRSFGRPQELRFYNACKFGHPDCNKAQQSNLRGEIVEFLPDDPALRARLNKGSICIREKTGFTSKGLPASD